LTAVHVQVAHGIAADQGAKGGLARLDASTRRAVLIASGLRHATAYGVQAALCALAAKAAIAGAAPVPPDRRALLSNGGPWAAETALGFLRSAEDRGPQFVNPLIFPATLASSGPTAAATAVEARAAALAVGFDELAFFEVLHRGLQLLRFGLADEVLAVAASGASPALATALALAGRTSPLLDCAIAFRLTHDPAPGPILLDALLSSTPPWPEVEDRWEANVGADGRIEGPIPTPLRDATVLSAAGGVLCQAALRGRGPLAGTDRYVVVCRKGRRYGGALFASSL
jgi:hypothetical protein